MGDNERLYTMEPSIRLQRVSNPGQPDLQARKKKLMQAYFHFLTRDWLFLFIESNIDTERCWTLAANKTQWLLFTFMAIKIQSKSDSCTCNRKYVET